MGVLGMASVFEILGPIMVGPSSSHTAGAVNIGRAARQVLGEEPKKVEITLYGSFAQTYKGHGTDRALIAGVLGMSTSDPNIKNALDIAKKAGIKVTFNTKGEHPFHPNTAKIFLEGDEEKAEIVGISIGGGRIIIRKIDDFEVDFSGEYHTLICAYDEELGVVAAVSSILAQQNINIAFMKVSRNEDRDKALMIVEVDQPLTEDMVISVSEMPIMNKVKYINKIEL